MFISIYTMEKNICNPNPDKLCAIYNVHSTINCENILSNIIFNDCYILTFLPIVMHYSHSQRVSLAYIVSITIFYLSCQQLNYVTSASGHTDFILILFLCLVCLKHHATFISVRYIYTCIPHGH